MILLKGKVQLSRCISTAYTEASRWCGATKRSSWQGPEYRTTLCVHCWIAARKRAKAGFRVHGQRDVLCVGFAQASAGYVHDNRGDESRGKEEGHCSPRAWLRQMGLNEIPPDASFELNIELLEVIPPGEN